MLKHSVPLAQGFIARFFHFSTVTYEPSTEATSNKGLQSAFMQWYIVTIEQAVIEF